MGCGGGFHGTVYVVGSDHGLHAHFLDLLQPALLPEVGVSTLSSAESTGAPCYESAFCVISDHTCARPRERLRYGVNVLLRNEDHELPKGSSRREYTQRAAEAERPCQGDGHAR